MPSHLQKATIQAAILNVTSSVLAQVFKSYGKSGPGAVTASTLNPLGLDIQFLESRFPAYPTQKGKQKLKIDDGGEGVTVEKKVDIRNTAFKFVIDQTLGASINTIAFLLAIKAMRGGSLEDCARDVKTEFWPIMIAGYKLWPLVSLLNFTLIPVEKRVVVGSLVGLGWGVFMALRTTA